MDLKKCLGVSGIVFFIFILAGSSIPLPQDWPLNMTEPVPSGSGCTSCSVKSSKNTIELPFIHDNGRVLYNLNLSTVSVVDTVLFNIRLGNALPYSPSLAYRIQERKDNKNLIVRIMGAQVAFPVSSADLGEKAVFSQAYPKYSIRKDGSNLVFAYDEQEFLFSPGKKANWQLAEVRRMDCRNRNLRLNYDEKDVLKEVVLPNGLKYEFVNENSQPVSIKDPAGARTEISWEQKRITAIRTTLLPEHPFYDSKETDSNLVREILVTYDDKGRIASIHMTNGDSFTAEYRSENNSAGKSELTVLRSSDGSAEFSRQLMDAAGNERTRETGIIVKSGAKETFITEAETVRKKIGSAFEVVSRRSDGQETRYEQLEEEKNEKAVTDALGRITRWEYDDAKRLTAEIYPDGSKRTIRYDDRGRVVERVSFTGIVSRYTYEGDRLASYSYGELTTAYLYDEAGVPVQTTMPDGTVHRFVWDDLFRLIAHIRPDGVKTVYTYPGPLNTVLERTVVSNDGKESYSIKFQYSPKGQLVKIVYPDGTAESFFYNCCNLVKVIDRAGAVTQYAYDAAKRKVLEISPNQEKTAFQYDEKGRLARVTYPNGTSRSYEYGAYGRLLKETDPVGSWKKYSYDAVGNTVTMTTSMGTQSRYAYDNMNRLLSVQGNAEPNSRYIYDKKGRSKEAWDFGLPAAKVPRKTSFEYDNQGRRVKVTGFDGSVRVSKYDAGGRLQYERDRDVVIYCGYGKSGEIAFVSRIPATVFSGVSDAESLKKIIGEHITERWSYDNFGNVSETQKGNGLFVRFDYSPDGQLRSKLYPISETLMVKETHVHSYKENGIREVTVFSKTLPR